MGNKRIMMIFISIVVLIFGCFLALKIKQKLDKKNDNWQWNDNWQSGVIKKTSPSFVENNQSIQKQILVLNYEEAISEAKKENKNIFIFFSADWCGYCTKMKSQTINDETVKESLKKYVYLYINTDSDGEIVKKFKVNRLPSFVVVDKDEKQLKKHSGFMEPVSFNKWLND
jgi:thioredoxin-related protein